MRRRLGTRSAKTTNIDVTTATEPANARLVAVRGDSHWPSSASRYGLSSPSPTMPPRMAMAFMPICTVVK